MARLEAVLKFVVKRNKDFLSAAVRTASGEIVISVGEHESQWIAPKQGRSSDTQVQVPILSGGQKWGHLELRFVPIGAPGLPGFLHNPLVLLVVFVSVAGFVVFYLYLSKVLHHLDPSRSIPGRVRAALDTLTEGLLVIDRKQNIVLANESFSKLVGKTPDDLLGKPAAKLAWLAQDGTPLKEDEFPWSKALVQGIVLSNDIVHLQDTKSVRRTFIV
ncbi:MAG: PAS domain-containing protein, partial [Betaproteobacteria bacterium]